MSERERLINELYEYGAKHPMNKGLKVAELDDCIKEALGVFADFILSDRRRMAENNLRFYQQK